MNFCDSSAGLAKARPTLVCFQRRVHPHIFKIKSFQTVWISGVFSVRSTRKFFKTKPSNSLIFCAFNVSYNRTFFKIKASNSLNFSCFQCTLNPHFSKNQGLTQVEFQMFAVYVKPTLFKKSRLQTVSISGVFSVRSTCKLFKIKPSNSLNFRCFHSEVPRTFFIQTSFFFVGNLYKNSTLVICLKTLPERKGLVAESTDFSSLSEQKRQKFGLKPVHKLSLVTRVLSGVLKCASCRSSRL